MTRTATLALLLLAGPALAQFGRNFWPRPDQAPAEPPAIRLPPIVPPEWTLLSQPAVRAELGLTKEQAAALDAFQNPAAGEAVSAASLGWLSPEAGRALLSAGRDAYVSTGLTKAQQARLKQILFQLKEKEFGSYAAFAMSARDLGLRPDQKEDVSWLKGQRVDEIAKLVTSGERFEKVKGQVAAANTDTFEKMAEMLTRTQRERLKDLRGKPFGGKVEVAPGPEKKPEDPAKAGYPPALFGLYEFEVRYLWGVEGLTDGQKVDVIRGQATWDASYSALKGDPIEKAADLHDETAKLLNTVLTAKQRKRFDELMARRRLEIGGLEAACGYPPVVAALKLTPAELTALKERKPAAEVLGKARLEALEKFFGEPAELSPYVIDPIRLKFLEAKQAERGFGRQNPEAFARHFLAISDRLKLSADQVKKLRELAEDEPKFFDLIQRELDFADTPPVTGAGRGLTVAGGVAEKFRAAAEKQCWDVLDEKQRSLAAQFYGRRR